MRELNEDQKKYLQECLEAQEKFCSEHHYPNFVPASGFCWKCGEPIYFPEESEKPGEPWHYHKKDAETNLFTGCHSCGWSYCD